MAQSISPHNPEANLHINCSLYSFPTGKDGTVLENKPSVKHGTPVIGAVLTAEKL